MHYLRVPRDLLGVFASGSPGGSSTQTWSRSASADSVSEYSAAERLPRAGGRAPLSFTGTEKEGTACVPCHPGVRDTAAAGTNCWTSKKIETLPTCLVSAGYIVGFIIEQSGGVQRSVASILFMWVTMYVRFGHSLQFSPNFYVLCYRGKPCGPLRVQRGVEYLRRSQPTT